MLQTPWRTCQRHQRRSIMQWCDQKIGSNADCATMPMSPPTQPWTRSCWPCTCVEKSSKLVRLRMLSTVAAVGSDDGEPELRRVRGGLVGSAAGTGPELSDAVFLNDAGMPLACDAADVQSHHG